MAKTLDARGLACPGPVLMVKDVVERDHLDLFEVIVDSEAAKENVSRFLGSQHFSVTASQEGKEYRICARRRVDGPESVSTCEVSPLTATDCRQRIMVLIATDRLGFGDDELGKKLMINFIRTIKEMGEELWRLVFVNNGVKLAIDGSPVLEDLLAYERDGLTILVCGTCLSHFGLLEAKKVGDTTNMLDIVTSMQLADKVIHI